MEVTGLEVVHCISFLSILLYGRGSSSDNIICTVQLFIMAQAVTVF